MKTACVFAHFDRHGKVDEYVLYYLRELQKVTDLIQFVTTAKLSHAERRKIEQPGVTVLQRDNEGYDFYSYKLGIESLDLSQFDELLLCNDSVYGPLSALPTVFDTMRARGAAFWGLTDSYEVQHHLQSYFLVFTRAAMQSDAFRDFWQAMQVLDDKQAIIRRYEVGLSRALVDAGLRFAALAQAEKASNLRHIAGYWHYYSEKMRRHWKEPAFWADGVGVAFGRLQVGRNATHLGWKTLIEERGVPFVKVELLRDNPKGMNDLDEVYDVIRSAGDYPVPLIEDHLRRMRDSPPK